MPVLRGFNELLSLLRSVTDEIYKLSSVSAESSQALQMLSEAMYGFSKRRIAVGSLRDVAIAISTIGKEAGLTQAQINKTIQSLYELNKVGKAGFYTRGGMIPYYPGGVPGPGQAQGGLDDVTLRRQAEQRYRAFTPEFLEKEFSSSKFTAISQGVAGVRKQFQAWGTDLDQLRHVQVEANGALVRWSADMKLVGGVVERVSLVTNAQGKIVADLQRRYRSFFSAIGRDIGEFLKWSIAASVIYVPLRKMNQLLEESIELQSKLADVQVALSTSTQSLNRVFDAAANIAREMGVPLAGVIDGYVLAVRAAGNIRNETERLATAEALLTDSMILAKLSGMDQAKALDTLVGALRQANLPLTEGQQLLDKWVAITKVANVDLATLASSFAITATAAEDAGVKFDELNGIIAAVAESSILSAEETGNAVRAFIAGFQSAEAQKELSKYGIAIRGVNGDLRSFIDIIEDIVERRDQELISDRQLAEISNALGGGYRRGAQIALFLRNYSRAQELAGVSEAAHGDAADALAVKLDTLQTAATNLNNAFSELARALGQEGGILESGAATLEFLTDVLDAITQLIKVLGDATPKLVSFAVAWALLNKTAFGKGVLQGFRGLTAGGLFGSAGGPGILADSYASGGIGQQIGAGRIVQGGLAGARGLVNNVIPGIRNTYRNMNVGRAAGTGVGVGTLMAAPELLQGEFGKAGTMIGGAVVGTLITAGSPIGGAIGSVIGSAFYDAVAGKRTDYAAIFAPNIDPTTGKPKETEETAEEGLSRLIGKAAVGRAGGIATGESVISILSAITGQERGITGIGLAGVLGKLEEQPEGLSLLQTLFGSHFGESLTAEDNEKILEYIELLRAEGERAAKESADTTRFGVIQTAYVKTYGGQAQSAYQRLLAEQREKLGKGLIRPTEYKEFEESGQGIATRVGQIFTALGESGAKAATGTDSAAEAYTKLTEIVLGGSDEIINSLLNVASAYESAYNAGDRQGIAGADRTRQQLIELTRLLTSGQKYQAYQIPGVTDIVEGTTRAQLEAVVQEAERISQERLEAFTLDPDEQAKIRDTWVEPWFQIGEDVSNVLGILGTKVDQAALDMILKERKLAGSTQQQLGIQQPDINTSQWNQLKTQLPAMVSWLQSTFGADNITTEDIGLIFNDRGTDIINTNLLALALLLEDIKDLNEKQLEGVFNLPEGMAALLPYTGKAYFSTSPINRDSAGLGFPYGPGEPVPVEVVNLPLSNATSNATWEDVITSRAAGNQAGFREYPTEESPRQPYAGSERAMLDLLRSIEEDAAQYRIDEDRPREKSRIRNYLEMTQTGKPEKIPSIGPGGLPPKGGMNFGLMGGAIGSLDGIMGALSAAVEKLLPSQIPISTNTTIETTNMIYIDGTQLQKEANKQLFKDFKLAKRRAGTLGFVTE